MATPAAPSTTVSSDPVRGAIKSLKKWIPVKKLTTSKKGGAVMPIQTMIAMWSATLLFLVPMVLYIHDQATKIVDSPARSANTITNVATPQSIGNGLRTLNGHPECQAIDFQINGSARIKATDELKQLPGNYRFVLDGNFTVKTDDGLVQTCGSNVFPVVPLKDLESGLTVNGLGKFTICKCN